MERRIGKVNLKNIKRDVIRFTHQRHSNTRVQNALFRDCSQTVVNIVDTRASRHNENLHTSSVALKKGTKIQTKKKKEDERKRTAEEKKPSETRTKKKAKRKKEKRKRDEPIKVAVFVVFLERSQRQVNNFQQIPLLCA